MYHVNTSHVDEWASQINDSHVQEWLPTGKTCEVTEVVDAVIQDADRCKTARPIYLYSTADGPLLAIALKNTTDAVELLDPCIVVFDGKSKINLLPIFGVSRVFNLARAALRSWQAPMELLLAAYPGFLVQNRMYRYQLRPSVPFVTTPELTNDGT